MDTNDEQSFLADLADGALAGPEWEAWLAEHPDEAAQVEIARRVRALIAELRAAEVEVPVGFEARLLARLREDTTLLDLLTLSFNGAGQALLELIDALLNLLPAPAPRPAMI
jgi:hypothetical protein